MTASDWISVVGTAVSLAGLAVSFLTWRQAKGAREAAQEAANTVRRREAAYEVSRFARDAKEIIEAVEESRMDVALHASSNLAHALSVMRSRARIAQGDSDQLRICVNDLESVAIRLRVDGIPNEGPKLESLLGACHDIHRMVCSLAGRLERLSED